MEGRDTEGRDMERMGAVEGMRRVERVHEAARMEQHQCDDEAERNRQTPQEHCPAVSRC